MTNKKLGPLAITAIAVVFLAAIPLLFVIYNSLQLDASQWAGLWSKRLPELLWNTLALALLVAIGCFILGVSAAWWIARYEFPGREIAAWLMILPLTIPTYVFAHIYTSILEDDGWLGRFWHFIMGANTATPDIYNIGGATLVLSLAGFSYVFLMARSALSHSTRTLEEAARIQGANKLQVFFQINLPLLRPAIAAGLAVAVLHVLSDFGAVSMLQYQTFTLSIYLQMSGRFDYQGAAGLSMVLVLLSLTFLVTERFFRAQQRYYSARQARRHIPQKTSTTVTVLIWFWLGLITLFAFILPLAWMLHWSLDAWLQDAIDREFWTYTTNSITVAILAATAAVICAFPIAFYNARKRSMGSSLILQLSSVGFVLPGPVIALGIISFILAQLPVLYGGMTALILALVVRFLPLAVQSQDATLQQLTPSIEQAGRNLGAGPLENLWLVILPMIRSGMATAWVLVFIDALKELPATLILRPTGFDTLPVRIWIEASEEMLELAAPAALMLVVGTLPIIWVLMKNNQKT
ncbi:MAG: iron ABC transporter permease [Gammaproteobacteria bacterium]|nr:iron ABC transporter permease [Gammaproteobacteria bacterium]MDH5802072.1 iron ABC transporter permease [Gammaproteobacteria bacterium]